MKLKGEVRKQMLTAAQAANALGLQESTVRAWILRRKLPYVKVGRAVRIPAEAVEKFIRENTVPAREAR